MFSNILNIFLQCCMNVQGCNDPTQRDFTGMIFEETEFGVLVATEAKRNGREKFKYAYLKKKKPLLVL